MFEKAGGFPFLRRTFPKMSCLVLPNEIRIPVPQGFVRRDRLDGIFELCHKRAVNGFQTCS